MDCHIQALSTAHPPPLLAPPPALYCSAIVLVLGLRRCPPTPAPPACPTDLSDEEPQSGSDFNPGAADDSGSDVDLEAEEEPQPKKKAAPRKRAAPKKKGEHRSGILPCTAFLCKYSHTERCGRTCKRE